MLSLEERELLGWLTANYARGAGAVVDGGCFVGGSTVPLAEGLRASGREGVIDVYDLFEVEPYMTDFYFKDTDLRPGDSFRPLFDANTAHVADRLAVHEGDLAVNGWSGAPIEVMFVDCAKAWSLNDFIVQEFFSCLIPGRSIVVQQDYVYATCPWVVLTMEALADCFVPVGFAEYCSVVYLCVGDVSREAAAISELGHERRMELMERAMARFRGYPRAVLACAQAFLLVEHGDLEAANALIDRVERTGPEHYAVAQAVQSSRAVAQAAAAA